MSEATCILCDRAIPDCKCAQLLGVLTGPTYMAVDRASEEDVASVAYSVEPGPLPRVVIHPPIDLNNVERNAAPSDSKFKFHLWTSGDASVGIAGERATVEMDISGYNKVDREHCIKLVRYHLKHAFASIWDGQLVHVRTQDEIP